MLSQRIITRNPKTEAYLDLLETASGIALVGFLWAHMLFLASILIGPNSFDTLAHFFDYFYLSYTGVPIIILIALIHFVVAGRRIPTRIQEQKIVWQHAKLLRHTDTWTWVFQVITGMAILVLAGIHLWLILSQWPIESQISAERIKSFWWYYLILLALAEYHASIGVYRVFVKWGWFPRKSIWTVLKFITLIVVGVGLAIIWVLYSLGGVA